MDREPLLLLPEARHVLSLEQPEARARVMAGRLAREPASGALENA